MPPSEEDSTPTMTSPSSSPSPGSPTPDSPSSGSSLWVEIKPLHSPGLDDQQWIRSGTSSMWFAVSQASTRASLAGAGEVHHKPCRSDTTALGEPLTDTNTEFDTGTDTDTDTESETLQETSRPATPAAQSSTGSPSSHYQTHHEPSSSSSSSRPGDDDDDDGEAQQAQQPWTWTWTWRTLLLVEDRTDQLGLDVLNCAAITLREGDVASHAALRAKVLATLENILWRAGSTTRGRGWLEGGGEGHIFISWGLGGGGGCAGADTGAGADDRGPHGRVARENVAGTSLVYITHLLGTGFEMPGEGGGAEGEGGAWQEEGEGEEEEEEWLRENIMVAASRLGETLGAVLLVSVLGCGAGDGEDDERGGYGDGDDVEYDEDGRTTASSDEGMACGEDREELEGSQTVSVSFRFL